MPPLTLDPLLNKVVAHLIGALLDMQSISCEHALQRNPKSGDGCQLLSQLDA